MIRSKKTKYLSYLVLFFLYLPVLILILSSFKSSKFGTFSGNWTIEWYKKLLHEPAIWNAFINSITVAIYSSISATVLGITAALAMYRYSSFLQKIHLYTILAPLAMPEILLGISLLFLFITIHLKLSLFTVYLAHTTFSVSYIASIVKMRLDTLDKSLLEAARDLGATSSQIFWKIILPIISSAVIGSAFFAFTISLDDFVITFFVVGPGATTLPVYVYSMMKFGSPPLINALSTIILVISAFITSYFYRYTEKSYL